MNTILLLVLVILNALVLYFWKPWLGAYGAEKAKNYARQEDLEKILSEVRAVTVATKKIEAKISVDVWDRQKRWEIKREAFFEAVKEWATAEDALTRLDGAWEAAKSNPENVSTVVGMKVQDMLDQKKVEAIETWRNATLSFRKACELASLSV